MQMEPAELIENLRKTDPYIEAIFMQGGCYRFHLFLKSIWPDALPMMSASRDHIGTQIGDKIYDIRGASEEDFAPATEDDMELASGWSFSKVMMLQIAECPVCEEPIVA